MRTKLASALVSVIACAVAALLAWSHFHGAGGWGIRGARGWFGLVTLVSGVVALVAVARALPQRERELPVFGAVAATVTTVCLMVITCFVALVS